jgi:hypothetical protein
MTRCSAASLGLALTQMPTDTLPAESHLSSVHQHLHLGSPTPRDFIHALEARAACSELGMIHHVQQHVSSGGDRMRDYGEDGGVNFTRWSNARVLARWPIDAHQVGASWAIGLPFSTRAPSPVSVSK